jgi:F-type H+-transporting ATPase subunit delta
MTSRNIKLAQPYAEALLELTSKDGNLEKIINDLNSISNILSESVELRKAISNPTLPASLKKDIIKSIFGTGINSNVTKFLMVLCDRGRISYLADILEKALEIAYKKASIEVAYVISSNQLTASQEEALILKLQAMSGAKQIKLKLTVDEALIGGFIVQVGSKIIDSSIRGQLRQLDSYLGASIV